ncbi:hypothetical protein CSB20_06590 [bacterium DOLZORAL124_64_63]|nr:MAG: hypothetical protein CSB20_06590 [bacterium DOLZORAL124_64_63]
MMRRLIFLSLLLLACASAFPVLGQTPFALSNIGQPAESRDARMVGRGGWGMAVQDSLNPGFTNLASLTDLRHVAVRFTVHGEKGSHKDSHGSRTTHRTMIPDVRVGLPVIKGRLALSAGMEVLRSFEYRTQEPKTWYAWDDTLSGYEQFLREGTLWRVPFGVSWQPVESISLGASLGLVQGALREELFNYFREPSDSSGNPLYLTTGRTQEDTFSGTMATLAMRLGSADGPMLGVSYTPGYDLDAERKLSVGGLVARSYDTYTLSMPEKWEAGFQLPVRGRWHLGADARYQPFSRFSGYADWEADMVDEYVVSLGLERELAFARHGGGNNRPLRVGLRVMRWGYQMNGADIMEKTISVGTGFPFRRKMGMLDVALSYSRLGDEAKNGLQSDIWRLTVSVAGLERWW